MDFTLPPEIDDIRLRTRAFVEAQVLPLEADRGNYDDHENIRLDVLARVRDQAKAAGLWAPQTPKDYGGMGLPIVGWAAMYEEANRSIFGPVCFNCAAPDDGNMNLLALVGTPAQKDKWLRPIVDGSVRSAFAMTEPAPGGGSDPGMIRTRAEKKGDRWVIRGHKWFITGAGVADHFILVGARRMMRGAASRDFCSTGISPAGKSYGASRSWVRRSTAATASSSSTASKCRTRTC
jgi:acyl-CoA dehydrogenase